MSLRNTIAIVFLAGAAAASSWWSREPPDDPARRRTDDSALPGYYAHGTRLTGTDEQGRVLYRLRADSLEEVPDDESYAMAGVRVEYTPADEVPWSLTATRASRPKSDARLDLEGEVELRSVPADGVRVYVITTARLQFDPDQSWVESDQRVDLRVGDLTLSGVGLGLNLNEERLQLKSDVHGQIAP